MYSQLNEQLQNSFKPVSELLEINYKAVQTLAKQQSDFFTEAMSQSMAFTQSLVGQKDIQGYVQAQKEYGDELQNKLVTASKEAYSVLTEAQGEATEVVKSAFGQVGQTVVKQTSKAKTAK